MLLAVPLSRPERHRTHVLPPERLSPDRHSLRPKRGKLPRRRLPRRRRHLLVMSPSLIESDPKEGPGHKVMPLVNTIIDYHSGLPKHSLNQSMVGDEATRQTMVG